MADQAKLCANAIWAELMRPAYAQIDLAALRANFRLAKQLSVGQTLAVLKADAYGHGAVACARALVDIADGFAVASVEEALELRQAGITIPILLLEGFFHPSELDEIAHHQLTSVVAYTQQLAQIVAFQNTRPRPMSVWLKVDTGMHRLGFDPSDLYQAWQQLQQLPLITAQCVMTHLSCADELDNPLTEQQLQLFRRVTHGIRGQVSVVNSAGLLGWPDARDGWARPGLMMYGISPFSRQHPVADTLRPVMHLRSQIMAMRELPAGEAIGYGGRFVTQRTTKIGVVAIGYADGYPQHAPDGTPVMVNGHRCPLAGRVSMDMLTLDLTDHPNPYCGAPVELWGGSISVAQLAKTNQTSAYELLCRVKRVTRRYFP